jgi:hypothetical protein
MQACELGFHPLSVLYCPLQRRRLERSAKDMVEQYLLFFWWFTVSISGGVGKFVPMPTGVERGDATGVWSFLNISVLQLIPLHCTVHQLGESDS